MKEFKHLMLDLETMGNQSNSAIVSIGAVEFDLETGETGEEFYQNVDLQSCLDIGLGVDASTVMWWLKQNEQARQDLTLDCVDISEVLERFKAFCFGKNYHFWGNSVRFDCGILKDAYNKSKMKEPWNVFKELDVRTLVYFNPEIKKRVIEEWVGTPHNAVDDCYKQIKYCCETYKILEKNG